MMLSYKSDFPNQVHQLNVSISQHYFLLKDGTIKWQEKKLDINWRNYKKTNKRPLVTFIIRDHYSSCFYAEFHALEEMPDIEDFLFNAWSKKDDYDFWGVGHHIVVPQSTLDQFPKLHFFFKRAKDLIHLQLPTSGFSSAVCSIREWERQAKYVSYYFQDTDKLLGFQQKNNLINSHINDSRSREDSNLKKWLLNKPRIISPNSKEVFYRYFDPINLEC